MSSDEEEPAAWLRAAILERKARAEALAVTVGASGWTVRRNDDFDYTVYGPLADIWREDTAEWMAANDPRDAIARCEAELAILKAHHILHRNDCGEEWEEFSVTPHPGANGCDFGCVTCHYRGMGGVWGKGYCYTVRALAQGYRHQPGFPAVFAGLKLGDAG